MRESHQNRRNNPIGGMDQDTDLTLVAQEDYRFALNIRGNKGSVLGAKTNLKGNGEVVYNLPAGENKCIGTCEDKRGVSVIYFVYNSNGSHLILRYFPRKVDGANPYGVIERVIESPTLNFNEDWLITHVELIDGKYLYWTDAYTEEGGAEGNPQRKINIEKANVTNRPLTYHIHLRQAQDFLNNVISEGLVLDLEVNDGTANQVTSINNAILQTYIGDPDGFLGFLTTTINNAFTWAEAELCDGCEIIVRTTPQNGKTVTFEINQNYGGFPPLGAKTELLVVPFDHYPVRYTSGTELVYFVEGQHIDLIKYPPLCEPRVQYQLDEDLESNNVNKNLFQFRVRYWYDDGEISAWGPISNIPLFVSIDGVILDSLNRILVNFTEARLNTIGTRSILKKVEIAVREGNLGLFKSIRTIDVCKIGIDLNQYDFYNDRLYSVVPSDDLALNNEAQVLKLFDTVPLLSGCLESYSDEEGSTRLYLGANVEGFDVDCIDIDYEVVGQVGEDCLVTIRGTVAAYDYSYDDSSFANPSAPPAVTYDNKNPVFLPSTRPVSYKRKVLDGIVVYAAGTQYFTISEGIKNDGTATGTFELQVPKGKIYTLRIASVECAFSSVNGQVHNLNNGTVWQKTSGPIIDFANSQAIEGRRWERRVDLTDSNGGDVFDLDTEPNYGEVKILNYHWDDYLFEVQYDYCVQEVYLLDNDGEDDAGQDEEYVIKKGAIGVEGQLMGGWFAYEDSIVNESLNGNNFYIAWYEGAITDHNGQALILSWYFNGSTGPGPEPFNNPIVITADPCDTYAFDVTPTPNGNLRELVWDDPVLPDQRFNTNSPLGTLQTYSGGLYELETEALNYGIDATGLPAPTTVGGGALAGETPLDLLVFVTDEEFTTKNKTIIQGEVKTQLGVGIEGVSMVYENNGKWELTNVAGRYSIAAYLFFDDPNFERIDDVMYALYMADVCSEYLPTPATQQPAISAFCTLPYDIENPISLTDFVMPLDLPLVVQSKYLKRGGKYRWGVVYLDRAGRMSTVQEDDNEIYIPYHTEDNSGYGKKGVEWRINHRPPEWATHYRIVRTKEANYRRFFYWATPEVRYGVIDEIDDVPVFGTFNNANNTHIFINISPIITQGEGTPVSFFFYGTNQTGFEPQLRDRVRFILDENSNVLRDDEILDFEIVGVYTFNDEFYAVIERPELFQEIKAGWLLEFYSPRKDENAIFYECGECHEIIDALTANRRHKGPIQDQVIGSQPAKGYLVGGDTYWRRRDFPIGTGVDFLNLVETSNFSDRFDSEFEDIGRPNIVDDTAKENFYSHQVRASQLLPADSTRNGLSSFIPSDVNGVSLDFGIIKRLITAQDVLLAVCEFKIQPIYVAKDNILALTGDRSLGRSDRLLNLGPELKQNLGTMNPESVVEHQGWVYGWDVYRGIVWRYAKNGLYPISDYKMETYFSDLGKRLLNVDRKVARAFGGFDEEYDTYLLSFAIDGEVFTEEGERNTVSFKETDNRFNTFLSFIPEQYGKFANRLVSFKDGRLWLHDVADVPYNNFYGQQYNSKIGIVFNDMPRAMKILYNVQVQANSLWFISDLEIPPNSQYPLGMKSRIKASNWSDPEGVWTADFLRDINDPSLDFASITSLALKEATALLRGRPLRGHVATITFELENPEEYAILNRVDIEHSLSRDTKT